VTRALALDETDESNRTLKARIQAAEQRGPGAGSLLAKLRGGLAKIWGA
jgi:hypothetical protein